MANLKGELALDCELDGRAVAVECRYWWSGGGSVLTIATVIPDPACALEVISTFVGHRDTETVVTHLAVARGLSARIATASYPHAELNTLGLTRHCAYVHCSRLADALIEMDHVARVHVGEGTFAHLERVA